MFSNHHFEIYPGVAIGGERPLLMAGPCVIESEKIALDTAESLTTLCQKLQIPFVYKSSYDKANRTADTSFRSIGFDEALKILVKVKSQFNIPIITDVHETIQVDAVAQVADVIQIPAFLCRQTDLVAAAARSGRVVNIKKGQFMAPEDMRFIVEKARNNANDRIILTERGSSFGYHNLVVDIRSLPIMRQFAPVVFDVTHSVQTPGGLGGRSGGQREFAPVLARAAAAVGADGFFIETHPDPDKALSDGPNMIPLTEMKELLQMIIEICQVSQQYR